MSNRLKFRNTWDYHIYSVGAVADADVTSLSSVKIGPKKYRVITEYIGVHGSDMGNPYTSYSNHYFVEEKVFGKKLRFDLATLIGKGVKVEAVKFTIRSDK